MIVGPLPSSLFHSFPLVSLVSINIMSMSFLFSPPRPLTNVNDTMVSHMSSGAPTPTKRYGMLVRQLTTHRWVLASGLGSRAFHRAERTGFPPLLGLSFYIIFDFFSSFFSLLTYKYSN